MGNGGWTNDSITTLIIPTGAQTGPRIVVGTDIPSVLGTWGAANNVTFTAVFLIYWNDTDFFFEATGTFIGQQCVFTGTYDTTNSVYVQDRILDTGAGAIDKRFGSYALNAFQELWTTQQIKVRVGDGSQINDLLVANCDVQVLGSVYALTAINTVETWHTLTLASGWTGTLKYRLVPTPAKCVQLVSGTLTAGTKANGTTIGTLPAGYRPITAQDVSGTCDNVVAGGQSPHFNITAAGAINCFGMTAATFAAMNCLISLDF